MSLFGNILEKLGIKRPAGQPKPVPPTVQPPKPSAPPVSQPKPAPPVAQPSRPSTPPASQAKPAPPTAQPSKPSTPPASQAKPLEVATSQFASPPAAPKAAPAPAEAPVEVPMVDVMSKLESLSAANPQKLNWKVSIVDLLKLLDIDSSYAARKELAIELGCPADKMGDSAKMNEWLHKTVLQKIAENGGNIPKELLD